MKVGSDREAASSPDAGQTGLGQDPWFKIAVMPAGTLQNWPCSRGIYSDKAHQEHVGFSFEIVLTLAFSADLE